MIFVTREIDGNLFHFMDVEAIDYWITGLQALRDEDVGCSIETPSFVEGDDGLPQSGSYFVVHLVDRAPQ